MATLYGIPNCSTVRKARAWLEEHAISYDFHDYKKRGIDRPTLERWISETGWDRLLNQKGTTFRTLPETERTGLTEEKVIALMIAHPSVIRRPVVEGRGPLLTGFDVGLWASAFDLVRGEGG